MSVQLFGMAKDKGLTFGELRNGQICVIGNCLYPEHKGLIVQRYGNSIIQIGGTKAWDNCHVWNNGPSVTFYPLPNFTKIEIIDNV